MSTGNVGVKLALDGEQRRQLGLSADEELRLLNGSERFLLFERSGDDHALAVPWDRSLVLSADVRSFPLADLFSMIHDAGKSGFLIFNSGPAVGEEVPDPGTAEATTAGERTEKAIYFRRGEVVFASSSDRADRLGPSLLRAGQLTLDQLREAENAWSASDRLGKILVERGLLSPRELWNAVKHQIEEIVRSLFAFTQGQIYFWEGDVQPDNVVRLVLPTRRLVKEGLRRRDEIFRFLAMLENRRVVLTALPEVSSRLTGNERALHGELAKTSAFSPACHAAGLDPLTGARVIQLLSLLGAVRIEKATSDRVAAQTEDDAVRERVGQHVKLLSELVAPLVAMDGSASVVERLRAVMEEAAERYPEMFSDLSIGAGAVLDPEELVERSLRVGGDRAEQVAKALGELVAYVEFELMNHPEIDDPQQFLEALESLRASIR